MTDKEKQAVNELSAYLNHIGVDPTAWGAVIETKETETATTAEIDLTDKGGEKAFYGVVKAVERDLGTCNIERSLKASKAMFMGLFICDQVNDWNGTGKPIVICASSDCNVASLNFSFTI